MTKNSFKSYALIITITAILTLISTLPIGIFGVIITALLASTIGYTITKHHYYFVAVVCSCVLFIYSAFSGEFIASLTVSLPIILSGIALGIVYNLKSSDFIATGAITGIYTVYLLLNAKILSLDFNEFFSTTAKSYSDVLFSVYENQFTQAEIDTIIAEMMSVTLKFMPSFIIILCGCLALLELYIFKRVLKLTKSELSSFKPFDAWHADKSFSIVFFALLIISLFLPEKNYFSDAIANVVLVSEFVFYIFGLSLVDYLLILKMKNHILRRIVLVLLALFSLGAPRYILCFLGAVDGCINLREKLTKNNLPKQE